MSLHTRTVFNCMLFSCQCGKILCTRILTSKWDANAIYLQENILSCLTRLISLIDNTYDVWTPLCCSSTINVPLTWSKNVMEEHWGTTLCCPRTSALSSWWECLLLFAKPDCITFSPTDGWVSVSNDSSNIVFRVSKFTFIFLFFYFFTSQPLSWL